MKHNNGSGYNNYSPDHTVTGTLNDPAFFFVLPLITAANVMGYRVDRAKFDLSNLPPLKTPTNYATAYNTAVALRPNALLDVTQGNAFIAAVAAAGALLPP